MKIFFFLLISVFVLLDSNIVGFELINCDEYFNKTNEDPQELIRNFYRSLDIDKGIAEFCYLKYENIERKIFYNCSPLSLQ